MQEWPCSNSKGEHRNPKFVGGDGTGTRIALCLLSRSGLFDGDKERAYHEGDLPNPLTRYGASKLEGEKRVCNAHAGALIFRAG